MSNFKNEKNSADMFDALFEAIHDYAFILHTNGSIWDVNKNALIHLGYNEDELIGKHILQLTPAGAACDAYDQIWDLTNDFNKVSFETAICNKNNEEVPVEINAHFLGKDVTGTVLVSYRDVSFRKKIENGIENRQNTYSNIIQSCPDGFLMIKPDGQILDSNPAYTKISGYTKEELLTRNYFDIAIGKKNLENKNTIAQNSLFNNFHKNKNGDVIPVRIKMRPWKNENGVDVILMFVYTINEYLLFLKQIQKERQLMKKILSSIGNKDSSGILITKVGSGIKYANEFIAEALGYTKNELEKLTYKDFIHPADLALSMQDYAKIVSGDNAKIKTKWRLVRQDGNVISTEITVDKQLDDSGNAMLITQFDDIVVLEEKIKDDNQPDIVKLLSKIKNEKSSGILVSRPGAGFCYANKFCYETFGYKNNEMENIQANDFIHPDDFDVTVQNITKVFKDDLPTSSAKGRYLRKDGSTIVADLTITKQLDESTGVELVILQFENITEPTAAEITE